jgi:hypothetical protein
MSGRASTRGRATHTAQGRSWLSVPVRQILYRSSSHHAPYNELGGCRADYDEIAGARSTPSDVRPSSRLACRRQQMPSSGHNDIEDCAGLTARDQGSRGDRRHGLPLRGNEFPGTGASGRRHFGQAGAASGQGLGPWGRWSGDKWQICVMPSSVVAIRAGQSRCAQESSARCRARRRRKSEGAGARLLAAPVR